MSKQWIALIPAYKPSDILLQLLEEAAGRVSDARKVCGAAQDDPEALVLGCRRLRENVPLKSRFGNTVTRLVYRVVTVQTVWDTQTGLRAFSVRLIARLLEIPGERYGVVKKSLVCKCKDFGDVQR